MMFYYGLGGAVSRRRISSSKKDHVVESPKPFKPTNIGIGLTLVYEKVEE